MPFLPFQPYSNPNSATQDNTATSNFIALGLEIDFQKGQAHSTL